MVKDSSNRIPTPEDFERADRMMNERNRGLDLVSESVLRHFRPRMPLHGVYIFNGRDDVHFHAYVFAQRTEDIRAMKHAGADREIIDFTYSELERVGRGRRNEIVVAVEFDSDERVQAEFQGSYYFRLL